MACDERLFFVALLFGQDENVDSGRFWRAWRGFCGAAVDFLVLSVFPRNKSTPWLLGKGESGFFRNGKTMLLWLIWFNFGDLGSLGYGLKEGGAPGVSEGYVRGGRM